MYDSQTQIDKFNAVLHEAASLAARIAKKLAALPQAAADVVSGIHRGGFDQYGRTENIKVDPEDPLDAILGNPEIAKDDRLRKTYGIMPGAVPGAGVGYICAWSLGLKAATVAPHHAHHLSHKAGKKGAVIGGEVGQFVGQKACDGAAAATDYLCSSTDLPRTILNLIFPGHASRMCANYHQSMAYANSFIVNNLGVAMTRNITSRGMTTSDAPDIAEAPFFGPNISSENAIKVASGIKGLLALSVDNLSVVDGQQSDLTTRLKRAGSGSYYFTHLVEQYQGIKLAGLTLASIARPSLDDASLYNEDGEMHVIDMGDNIAYLYNAILTCGDRVFDGVKEDESNAEFALTEDKLRAVVEGMDGAVDDRAEETAIYSSKRDHTSAAQDTVNAYTAKNLFTSGMRNLIVCGGDYDSLSAHKVACEVAKKAGNAGLERAFDMHAKPLNSFDLGKRSLQEANPFGPDAASVISMGGTRYQINEMGEQLMYHINEMGEQLMYAFQQRGSKELAHLMYKLKMATQDYVLATKIQHRIAQVEQIYADGFGKAAVDSEMKRFDLRDADGDRADGMSAMAVSGFGQMGGASAIDEIMSRLDKAGEY